MILGSITLLADFDGDGDVDIFDFSDYAAAYNTGGASADFDGDGDVDIFDFSGYAAAYNKESPWFTSGGSGSSTMGSFQPVPEPGTMLFILGGFLGQHTSKNWPDSQMFLAAYIWGLIGGLIIPGILLFFSV